MREATTKPIDPFFYQTLFISHYPSSYQPIYQPFIIFCPLAMHIDILIHFSQFHMHAYTCNIPCCSYMHAYKLLEFRKS